VKGATFEDHVQDAHKAHAAIIEISVIALLGVGGTARSTEHAQATARLDHQAVMNGRRWP
jgi:hypothetical protein